MFQLIIIIFLISYAEFNEKDYEIDLLDKFIILFFWFIFRESPYNITHSGSVEYYLFSFGTPINSVYNICEYFIDSLWWFYFYWFNRCFIEKGYEIWVLFDKFW